MLRRFGNKCAGCRGRDAEGWVVRGLSAVRKDESLIPCALRRLLGRARGSAVAGRAGERGEMEISYDLLVSVNLVNLIVNLIVLS